MLALVTIVAVKSLFRLFIKSGLSLMAKVYVLKAEEVHEEGDVGGDRKEVDGSGDDDEEDCGDSDND